MIRSVILGVLTLLILGALGASYWYGRQIPFAAQWPLFEALRTTASIIFAVVGAWLAIIYPERLKLSFKAAPKKHPEAPVKMGQLLHPAMHSTAILCAVLCVGIVAPILKQIPMLLEFRDTCRGLSYCLATALTLWQIWTVILTLVPADVIKTASDREIRDMNTLRSYRKGTTPGKRTPPP